MSRLALKIAVDKVLTISEESKDYCKIRLAEDIFYNILEPLVELEKQTIIDAYNQGRHDLFHENQLKTITLNNIMNTYEIYTNSIDEFINHNDINSVQNSVNALEKELKNLESYVSDHAHNVGDLDNETLNDYQIIQEYIKKGNDIIKLKIV